MKLAEFKDLDLSVARARIALSIVAMLSLYVDPSTAGGLFHLNTHELIILLCHLSYSVAIYFALSRSVVRSKLQLLSIFLDLSFATAIAFLTEGPTSASYVFFLFAIIAVGIRTSLTPTIAVTLLSVVLYLLVIVTTGGISSFYMMRAVYLAIAGYLIGFFSQQRALFEDQAHQLEVRAERLTIARSLHDGYVQALAGVNLRLESCRALLTRDRPRDCLAELTDLQTGVAREYDDVRKYLRSLAGVEQGLSSDFSIPISDPRFDVRASFSGRGLLGEHILQIMLEGLRNARRHGMATSVKIDVRGIDDKVSIVIEDDGVGIAASAGQPWAIASRVAELGGHLNMHSNGSTQLDIEIPNA